MLIGDQNETVLGRLAAKVRATPGTEIVRATPDHVVFCANRPRRTFDIRREGAHGFRVTEIFGHQPARRRRAALSCLERTIISQGQMTEWATARLDEARTSSLFSGGLSLPEGSAILMLIASAMITLWASTV